MRYAMSENTDGTGIHVVWVMLYGYKERDVSREQASMR